ncbi:MAG: Uncharacterised protein [Cryomorphaceae bacterium]|nr:MAG: Uncharacterised protein [Cryomorphaceae bacterium]
MFEARQSDATEITVSPAPETSTIVLLMAGVCLNSFSELIHIPNSDKVSKTPFTESCSLSFNVDFSIILILLLSKSIFIPDFISAKLGLNIVQLL